MHLKKIYLFTYLPLNCFFQNCIMAASSKNGPLTPACVRLKKKIINIALEAGCELITALGTHQHTCGTVLCCYTFPEVQMSSFTVITFLPPLTIDYLHFSISSPAVKMAHMARYPYSTDQAEQKCPPPGFYSKKGKEVRFTEGQGVKRGRAGHRATDSSVPYLPISSTLERTTGG